MILADFARMGVSRNKVERSPLHLGEAVRVDAVPSHTGFSTSRVGILRRSSRKSVHRRAEFVRLREVSDRGAPEDELSSSVVARTIDNHTEKDGIVLFIDSRPPCALDSFSNMQGLCST